MFSKQLFKIILILTLIISCFPLYELFIAKTPDQDILNRYLWLLLFQIPLCLLTNVFSLKKSDYEYLSYRYGQLWDTVFLDNKKKRKKYADILQYLIKSI